MPTCSIRWIVMCSMVMNQIRAAVPGAGRDLKPSSSRLPLVRHARPARRTPTGTPTPTALSSYFARDYYARLRDLTRLMLQ